MRRLSRTYWNPFQLLKGVWRIVMKKNAEVLRRVVCCILFCSMLYITLAKSRSTRGASHQLAFMGLPDVSRLFPGREERVHNYLFSLPLPPENCMSWAPMFFFWNNPLYCNHIGWAWKGKRVIHISMGHTSSQTKISKI